MNIYSNVHLTLNLSYQSGFQEKIINMNYYTARHSQCSMFLGSCRRGMAEILQIWCKTLNNQSINRY